MKRMVLALVATLALTGAQALHAATLTLTVTVSGSASGTLTLVGVNSVDLSGQTVAGVSFGSGSGATSNAPGGSGTSFTNESNLTLVNNNAGSVNVEVSEIASGFTSPTGPSGLVLEGTVLNATGAVNYTANGAAGATTIGPCNITAAPPSTCKVTGSANLTAPFSLSTDTTVVLAGGERLSSQTEIDAAVPEPASMALFGSGLLGLAGVLRRKRAR